MREQLEKIAAFFGLGTVLASERAGGHTGQNFFIKTAQGDYLIKITDSSCGVGDGRVPSEYFERLAANGFPIVPYVAAPNGASAFAEGNFFATVQARLDADTPEPEDVTEEMIAQIGAALAHLHRIPSDGLPPKKSWMRLDYLPEAFAIIKDRYMHFQGMRELIAAYDDLRVDWNRLPQAILHCDLTSDNTLFRGETLAAVIDWDEAGVGAAVLDFGLAVDWCFDEDRFDPKLYRILIEAYERVRPFSKEERAAIAPAVRFAGITSAVWRFLDGNHYHPEDSPYDGYLAFWEEGLDRWETP